MDRFGALLTRLHRPLHHQPTLSTRYQRDKELNNRRLLRLYRMSEYSAVEQLLAAFLPVIIMIDRYISGNHRSV